MLGYFGIGAGHRSCLHPQELTKRMIGTEMTSRSINLRKIRQVHLFLAIICLIFIYTGDSNQKVISINAANDCLSPTIHCSGWLQNLPSLSQSDTHSIVDEKFVLKKHLPVNETPLELSNNHGQIVNIGELAYCCDDDSNTLNRHLAGRFESVSPPTVHLPVNETPLELSNNHGQIVNVGEIAYCCDDDGNTLNGHLAGRFESVSPPMVHLPVNETPLELSNNHGQIVNVGEIAYCCDDDGNTLNGHLAERFESVSPPMVHLPVNETPLELSNSHGRIVNLRELTYCCDDNGNTLNGHLAGRFESVSPPMVHLPVNETPLELSNNHGQIVNVGEIAYCCDDDGNTLNGHLAERFESVSPPMVHLPVNETPLELSNNHGQIVNVGEIAYCCDDDGNTLNGHLAGRFESVSPPMVHLPVNETPLELSNNHGQIVNVGEIAYCCDDDGNTLNGHLAERFESVSPPMVHLPVNETPLELSNSHGRIVNLRELTYCCDDNGNTLNEHLARGFEMTPTIVKAFVWYDKILFLLATLSGILLSHRNMSVIKSVLRKNFDVGFIKPIRVIQQYFVNDLTSQVLLCN